MNPSMDAGYIWTIIIVLGVGTYLIRFSFLGLIVGKDLPDWHHLVCGDRNRVHTTGNSIRGRTVSEDTVFDEDPEDWIVDWEGNPP